MTASVKQTLDERTNGMQKVRVFRFRAVDTYTVIWLAVACSALALDSLCVHSRTCDRPRAQIFVGVATLHKRTSFIQPYHLAL